MMRYADALREQVTEMPDMPESIELLYIHNQNTQMELLGVLERYELGTHFECDNEYDNEYKLYFQHKGAVGKVLTDFISAKEDELSSKFHDFFTGLMSPLESKPAIAPLIVPEDEEQEDYRQLLQDFVENIRLIRVFVDTCIKNEALFDKWFYNHYRDEVGCNHNVDLEIECFADEKIADENAGCESMPFPAVTSNGVFTIDRVMRTANSSENGTVEESVGTENHYSTLNLTPKHEKITSKSLLIETYEHPVTLLWRLLEVLIENKRIVKRCRNCDAYFVPKNRSDTIYCSGPAPQDKTKTCGKYGSEQVWKANIKSNESISLYRKIYDRKQTKFKYHQNEETRHDFEKYKKESKQWKADVKAGIRSESEFVAWLKSF